MPWSASILVIWLSLIGLAGGSVSINVLMCERMTVEEQVPPSTVFTELEKKYFSSKMPRGVSKYFCVVAREMVDSCIFKVSAMSCRTMGRIA